MQALAYSIAEIELIERSVIWPAMRGSLRPLPASFPWRIRVQGFLQGRPRSSNPVENGKSPSEARVRLHSAALLRPPTWGRIAGPGALGRADVFGGGRVGAELRRALGLGLVRRGRGWRGDREAVDAGGRGVGCVS